MWIVPFTDEQRRQHWEDIVRQFHEPSTYKFDYLPAVEVTCTFEPPEPPRQLGRNEKLAKLLRQLADELEAGS